MSQQQPTWRRKSNIKKNNNNTAINSSNTFFDDAFENDLFASFDQPSATQLLRNNNNNNNTQNQFTNNTNPTTTNNLFFDNNTYNNSDDELMSSRSNTPMSSSSNSACTSESSPFFGEDFFKNDATTTTTAPSSTTSNHTMVNSILNDIATTTKATAPTFPSNATSPKLNKRKQLLANKRANKFKPTNLVLGFNAAPNTNSTATNTTANTMGTKKTQQKPNMKLLRTNNNNNMRANLYGGLLGDDAFGGGDNNADSQGLAFSQADYGITSSGQFDVDGLKIGEAGISAIPMTMSQSLPPSSPTTASTSTTLLSSRSSINSMVIDDVNDDDDDVVVDDTIDTNDTNDTYDGDDNSSMMSSHNSSSRWMSTMDSPQPKRYQKSTSMMTPLKRKQQQLSQQQSSQQSSMLSSHHPQRSQKRTLRFSPYNHPSSTTTSTSTTAAAALLTPSTLTPNHNSNTMRDIDDNHNHNNSNNNNNSSRASLSDYEEVRSLGHGASSTVTLVRSKKDQQLYAKKTLTTISNTGQPKMIYSEIKGLYKCRHCPYIIRLHQAFFKNDQIHILLEYMDGNSLEHVLKVTKHVPENILKHMAVQMLIGLEYLHTTKIVHRDIKPANILIRRDGLVKFSDFGLTGIYSALRNNKKQKQKQNNNNNSQSSSSTVSFNGQHYGVHNPYVFGTCQGTVMYMSPERIREEQHSFNSDVWSLGVTLAELGTGVFPFQSTQYFDILDEISNLKQLPLKNRDLYHYSDAFIDFVNQCTTIDASKRPSATQLLNEHAWVRDTYQQFYHQKNQQQQQQQQGNPLIAQWLSSFPQLFVDHSALEDNN